MQQLLETLKRNGLQYDLIERNDLTALYKLTFEGEVCGWEVARIHQQHEHYFGERKYSAAEMLPGNEQFGTEGSKAFHQDCRDQAEVYYQLLTEGLRTDKPILQIWSDFKNGLSRREFKALSPFGQGITPLEGNNTNNH